MAPIRNEARAKRSAARLVPGRKVRPPMFSQLWSTSRSTVGAIYSKIADSPVASEIDR